MLIPTRRRTWGPEGQTPKIPYTYKHDRISALAVLTVSPIHRHIGLYARFQQDNFKAVHVASFLRHLLRHLPGAVCQWKKAYQRDGPAALKAKPHPGPKPKLDFRQRQKLARMLMRTRWLRSKQAQHNMFFSAMLRPPPLLRVVVEKITKRS